MITKEITDDFVHNMLNRKEITQYLGQHLANFMSLGHGAVLEPIEKCTHLFHSNQNVIFFISAWFISSESN